MKIWRGFLNDTWGRIGGVPGRLAQVDDWVTYKRKPYRVAVCMGHDWFTLADHEGETIVERIPGLRQDLFQTKIREAN
jgi:hypothetical protein